VQRHDPEAACGAGLHVVAHAREHFGTRNESGRERRGLRGFLPDADDARPRQNVEQLRSKNVDGEPIGVREAERRLALHARQAGEMRALRRELFRVETVARIAGRGLFGRADDQLLGVIQRQPGLPLCIRK
jgi:hypothetical protein